MKKKQKVIAAVVLLVVAIVAFSKLRKKDTFVPISKSEYKEEITIFASSHGQVRPAMESFLSVNKSGKLERLNAKVGSLVHKGDILATVDEVNAKAELKSALSSYRLASSELARVRSLVASESATRQELDQSVSKLSEKHSALEQARQKFEEGVVRANIDGELKYLPFHVGDYVPSGSRVAVIEDTSSYKIVTTLPIKFVTHLSENVSFQYKKFDPLNDDAANMLSLSGRFEKQGEPVGVEKDQIEIAIQIGPIPASLRSGDAVKLRIPVLTYNNVTLVDSRAFATNGNKKSLVVLDAEGHMNWFAPNLGFPSDDFETVLNLPADAKIVVPEVKELAKLIEKKIAVKVETKAL